MKSLLATTFAVLIAAFATISVASETPFNQAQFDTLRSSGRSMAVVFHAAWCPTCRAQAPVLLQLSQTPELKDLTLFVADFDNEKALKQALHVAKQSTVVVFKNGKETARSTGDTQSDRLRELLRQGI